MRRLVMVLEAPAFLGNQVWQGPGSTSLPRFESSQVGVVVPMVLDLAEADEHREKVRAGAALAVVRAAR